MMEVKAHISNVRMAPRKVRGLREAVLGLPVREARAQLDWQDGKAAKMIGKVLNSAVANAQHNHELKEENLRLAGLKINDGTRLKRWRPVSRGMAHAFVRRTCQITVILEEIVAGDRKKKKPAAKQADIDTLTMDELARREQVGKSVKGAVATGRSTQPKTVGVFQKIKMQQQGGEKKKTHRRKSI